MRVVEVRNKFENVFKKSVFCTVYFVFCLKSKNNNIFQVIYQKVEFLGTGVEQGVEITVIGKLGTQQVQYVILK